MRCHKLGWFFFLFFMALPLEAAPESDLLLFGKAWMDPSDYAWSRESSTRMENDKEPGAQVVDVGRLRVRFIGLEEELLGLDIDILNYRFEVRLGKGDPQSGVSKLEGMELPPVWLHTALGFSVDSDPTLGRQNNMQAGEVFDLIDFRGFVPRGTPEVGEEWTAQMIRKPDDRFQFREERNRKFSCRSTEKVSEGDKFEIGFHETLKVTSMEASRSHEIRETEGTYWLLMPVGRVEAASWETVSTEYTSLPGKGGTSEKVETTTEVHLVRREPPPPKTRDRSETKEVVPEEPPLPPR